MMDQRGYCLQLQHWRCDGRWILLHGWLWSSWLCQRCPFSCWCSECCKGHFHCPHEGMVLEWYVLKTSRRWPSRPGVLGVWHRRYELVPHSHRCAIARRMEWVSLLSMPRILVATQVYHCTHWMRKRVRGARDTCFIRHHHYRIWWGGNNLPRPLPSEIHGLTLTINIKWSQIGTILN